MLQLKDINRSINKQHILKNINLIISNGEAVGIVWPNGCGKTSLLNLINGFTKSSTGNIIFNHKEINKTSIQERAGQGIGRVFQSFWVFKNLSIYENLALAYSSQLKRYQKLLPLKYLPKKYQEEIDDILHQLNLSEKKHQPAGNLSGGQMRLLEIGRLYLQDTQLYLLDEPTAGVSPKLKEKVVELLNKIIAKGKMVIIVEHDFEFLSSFVNNFFVMNDGQIVLEGNHNEVKNHPMIKEIYFGKDILDRSNNFK